MEDRSRDRRTTHRTRRPRDADYHRNGAVGSEILAFNADVTKLIQLYIVGVFISFTASQLGMVRHWGRELKLARGETEWTSDEFVHIAEEQTRREDAAAREANRVLVCDTNAFATAIWHRRYLGTDEPRVRAIAAAGRCDSYLLTGDEIPFVQDGLRDGEAIRHDMHGWFVAELARQPVPWQLLRGSRDDRLRAAMTAVGELFD